MEAAGESPATTGSEPPTSTPREAAPPPLPGLPERMVSSLSLSSDSSEEDWLIKVCCPGARHRHCKNARYQKPAKTKLQRNSDEEEELAGCSSASISYQSYYYPGVLRKDSSELEWLLRLHCPGAKMEPQSSVPRQSLPAVSPESKTKRGSISAWAKPSESWLTQKHLSAMQAVVSGLHCVDGSPKSLLERENFFVREVDRYLKHHDFLALRRKELQYKKWFENVSRPLLQKIQDKVDGQSSEEIEERQRKQLSLYLDYCNKHRAYLESYTPSLYDPFALKNSDIWKVSLPPLCDPLLKEVQDRYLEEAIIHQCDTGRTYSVREISEIRKGNLPLLPLSRQVMNPIEWLKVTSGYVESEAHQKSRQRMSTTRNKSTMDFKRWGDQSWLLPAKKFTSTRRSDFTSASGLLAKQRPGGSSGWKLAIKSAS